MWKISRNNMVPNPIPFSRWHGKYSPKGNMSSSQHSPNGYITRQELLACLCPFFPSVIYQYSLIHGYLFCVPLHIILIYNTLLISASI
jgi:hypothetical protein